MARKRSKRRHGTGSVYHRDGSWWIQWREAGRIQYRHGYPSREVASAVLDKIVADLELGLPGLPPSPKTVPALSELATEWIKRREVTHRSASEDRHRWRKHLAPFFGHFRPAEVTPATVRNFIEAKLAGGLSSSTVRLCVLEMSGLFSDLVERGLAQHHPIRQLPRSTRRLIRPAHDPRTTPFVERLEDVRRIYLALPEPINVAYALGALAGLRSGEVLGLRWVHVDLATRRIHVRESESGPLKDDDSRVTPIMDPLLPVLTAWKLRTGGVGRVVPPMRSDGVGCDQHTLRKHLKKALAKLKLPSMTWYQATRHTFASQWVLGGGSIEKLQVVMGHSSVQVTERYAHLRLDLFADGELGTIKLDLKPSAGQISYVLTTPTAHEEEAKTGTT